jgi:hypothetical protein
MGDIPAHPPDYLHLLSLEQSLFKHRPLVAREKKLLEKLEHLLLLRGNAELAVSAPVCSGKSLMEGRRALPATFGQPKTHSATAGLMRLSGYIRDIAKNKIVL